MHHAFKATILAEPKGSSKDLATTIVLQAAAKAACFLCLGILAARKRVYVFLKRQLVCHYIFLQLIADILCNRFLIATHCIHIVSSAPEVPISILIL